MANRSYSTSAPESSPRPQRRSTNSDFGRTNSVSVNSIARATAIEELRPWLQQQYERVLQTPVMTHIREANRVLSFLEYAWSQFEEAGELPALESTSIQSLTFSQARVAIPMELAGEVRPLINMTETAHIPSGAIDWNARLGIPEYRTQSDNFAAPEATCNTTTLAMILERLGYSRSDLIEAMENRFGITASSAEERNRVWEQHALAYINTVMNDSNVYRRIRGQASVTRRDRAELAENFRERAQFEDLLDLLLEDMGISRYGIISEPTRLLRELSGDDAGNTEMIWSSNWTTLSEKVKNCVENGGAAALSFRHKGSRSAGTHIVSILVVEENGFRIDDPYGDVREDYNPRQYDDAYWSRNTSGNLIQSRTSSFQQNEAGEFDDWGVEWMLALPELEERGKETFLSTEQIRRGFNYVQLFHRPNENTF